MANTNMRMSYGVNQADACQAFALGEARQRIQQQLRDINTRLVRLFLYDKGAPDPVTQWPVFVAYVEAVLQVGAKPMITFAKMHRPVSDLQAVTEFADRSGDVVRRCVEHWGGNVVRDWYWCVWNEPNNEWISGPVSFSQYRRIYEEIAGRCLHWLKPHLQGRKPLIGGPGIEGFQPFWLDWAWRFIDEIDNELIGFLDWHCYGDWRDHGENNAPAEGRGHRRLLMGMLDEYQRRANTIGQMLDGRGILNICGELNCHSHYTEPVRARFNHSVFGATFYIASLLQLMRAGVDAEMYWVGTEDQGGYGMMNQHGEPYASFHAKQLCAQHVRYGDRLVFPHGNRAVDGADMAVAHDGNGRVSVLITHLEENAASYDLTRSADRLTGCKTLLKIDEGTGNRIARTSFDGRVSFDGFGVAVATTEAS